MSSGYIAAMKHPADPPEKSSSYWIRGARTRYRTYFHPSDDRAGFALMSLITVLGLIALGVGLMHILGSQVTQRRDLVLAAIGLFTAAVGAYQASRLRDLSWRGSDRNDGQ